MKETISALRELLPPVFINYERYSSWLNRAIDKGLIALNERTKILQYLNKRNITGRTIVPK